MKKVLAVIAALTFVGSVAACGSESGSGSSAPNKNGWTDIGYDTSLKHVTINGIECIVTTGYHWDVSTSCNWPSVTSTTLP